MVKLMEIQKVLKFINFVQVPIVFDGSWDMIYDEIYMGRVEINANGGNKRRTLYFQADYIFNE